MVDYMENEFNMESGNLLKKIIVFTIPIILSSVLQLLFNAVDLIVVSKFSNEISLAAVGSTSSLINLIVNVFMGVSVGANVAVARGIGKKAALFHARRAIASGSGPHRPLLDRRDCRSAQLRGLLPQRA